MITLKLNLKSMKTKAVNKLPRLSTNEICLKVQICHELFLTKVRYCTRVVFKIDSALIVGVAFSGDVETLNV
jgi:hypothetical protein